MDIFEAARTNNIPDLKLALYQTNVNAKDSRGSTPLILATYYNHYEAARILLEAGADTELMDNMGNTALMGVSYKGYADIARLLTEHGASAQTANEEGTTALILAAIFGRNELIPLLLANGGDPLKRDQSGHNAIDHALLQEQRAAYEEMVSFVYFENSL